MEIILYGAGELGKQIHYLLHTYFHGRLTVIGFIDDGIKKGTAVINGLRVLGSSQEVFAEKAYSPEKVKLVLSIGYNRMSARKEAFERAKTMGYQFESVIHPNAIIEKNVRLGEGVIILAGAIIDQYVSLGNINFLHIGTMIGERAVIEQNNYFSAGSTIAGSAKVGENNFFGLNATIVNNIIIGSNNFVNAKSLIYKNIGDNNKVVELITQRIIGIKKCE